MINYIHWFYKLKEKFPVLFMDKFTGIALKQEL